MAARVFERPEEMGLAIDEAQAREQGTGFLRAINEFILQPPAHHPGDPRSEAYHEWVLEQYRALSGRSYGAPAANEVFEAPASVHMARPYPHCSADAAEVARYMMGVAHIISVIPARPPARIVEFGAGWGHVAINLAQMGFDTRAVDINPDSVHLLRERARRLEVPLEVIHAGFLDVDFEPGSIGCALFFESFHHCHRPFEMLERLDRWIARDGAMVFAAEPFYPGFHAPWGVRLDGQSVWAARHHGWLELGFEESFFVRELMRRGWIVQRHDLPQASAYGVVYVARRLESGFVPAEAYLPPAEAAQWAPHGAGERSYRWTSGDSPLPLPAGRGRIEIDLHNFNPGRSLPVTLACGAARVTCLAEAGSAATVKLDIPPEAAEARIQSPTWVPAEAGVNDDRRTLGVAVAAIRYPSA